MKKDINFAKTIIGAFITAVMFIAIYEWLSNEQPGYSNVPNDWDQQVELLENDIEALQENVSQIAEGIQANVFVVSSEEAQSIIKETSAEVMNLLKEKNMAALSEYAHPDYGVRFSPYTNINTARDRRYSQDDLKTALTDNTKHLWGYDDGSGGPIEMTFGEYYQSFVYDHPYHEAPQVGYNQILGKSNGDYNIYDIYKNAIIVEYHFPGFDERFDGMDWASLRLVFQEKNDQWYLVGVVHDQWTI